MASAPGFELSIRTELCFKISSSCGSEVIMQMQKHLYYSIQSSPFHSLSWKFYKMENFGRHFFAFFPLHSQPLTAIMKPVRIAFRN